MKVLLSIFFLFFFLPLFGQEDSVPEKYRNLEEVKIYKDYYKKYKSALRRIRKVYPLALYAAEKLKELDKELEQLDSKRKRKKLSKQEHKQLKDDFYYVIRDLYIEDGKMLMKLIHRETGMTVKEILEKYRGSFNAEFSESMGKIWEQQLDIKYDPKGEDWVAEQVIKDIIAEEVKIDFTPKILSREEYKTSKKEYKAMKKEYHKKERERLRAEKKAEKEKK
ncbi:MAG: hypothetical protein K0R65_692 [Crocinitomicaceae bacterium]|jgi:hypothetical protein|nr:hypothetical protein [Crocinitomicaceae bacterium]